MLEVLEERLNPVEGFTEVATGIGLNDGTEVPNRPQLGTVLYPLFLFKFK
jgi:hypothetical protein